MLFVQHASSPELKTLEELENMDLQDPKTGSKQPAQRSRKPCHHCAKLSERSRKTIGRQCALWEWKWRAGRWLPEPSRLERHTRRPPPLVWNGRPRLPYLINPWACVCGVARHGRTHAVTPESFLRCGGRAGSGSCEWQVILTSEAVSIARGVLQQNQRFLMKQ